MTTKPGWPESCGSSDSIVLISTCIIVGCLAEENRRQRVIYWKHLRMWKTWIL